MMQKSSPSTLSEWLYWQENLHPVSIDLGLERLRPVAERLGLSTLPMPVISVAGTNGKGSSVAYLEAMLNAQGIHNASYGSPWLHTYNESVRINSQAVSDRCLIQSFERVEQALEGTTLTCFEYRTLAAVDVMVNAQVDVAILEVGLGGRLDAVNLFDARVSIITTIGLDHQQWLGADLESIAREKAGIMRPGYPTICADPAMIPLLEPHAREKGAVLCSANRDYNLSIEDETWSYHSSRFSFEHLPMPALMGIHQLYNAAGAITALVQLNHPPELNAPTIAKAMGDVKLAGRLEFQERSCGFPDVLLDVAHNPQACQVLGEWLRAHPREGHVHAVCGMYEDKDPTNSLAHVVPFVNEWHLGSLPAPRGAKAEVLEQVLTGHCRSGRCYATITQAFQKACDLASEKDLVVVFGSFETVRQVSAYLKH